eukprot:TRINITY_DN26802_c0_g1_i1.p1 TRINITY_DN26802_c0_g1~~TRINITY_DN26802_c0_g1_i1.p1  ORF type:complete len:356 (+),score=82.50 TRINITY_DN26802_c0_g1_i1:93-1160(+)
MAPAPPRAKRQWRAIGQSEEDSNNGGAEHATSVAVADETTVATTATTDDEEEKIHEVDFVASEPSESTETRAPSPEPLRLPEYVPSYCPMQRPALFGHSSVASPRRRKKADAAHRKVESGMTPLMTPHHADLGLMEASALGPWLLLPPPPACALGALYGCMGAAAMAQLPNLRAPSVAQTLAAAARGSAALVPGGRNFVRAPAAPLRTPVAELAPVTLAAATATAPEEQATSSDDATRVDGAAVQTAATTEAATDGASDGDAPVLPSVGSAEHNTGRCKPCAFVYREDGCMNGEACEFCHLCEQGEKRRRAKARIAARAALAAAAKSKNLATAGARSGGGRKGRPVHHHASLAGG